MYFNLLEAVYLNFLGRSGCAQEANEVFKIIQSNVHPLKYAHLTVMRETAEHLSMTISSLNELEKNLDLYSKKYKNKFTGKLICKNITFNNEDKILSFFQGLKKFENGITCIDFTDTPLKLNNKNLFLLQNLKQDNKTLTQIEGSQIDQRILKIFTPKILSGGLFSEKQASEKKENEKLEPEKTKKREYSGDNVPVDKKNHSLI